MSKTECYSSRPEGLYHMGQEEKDKQFISDLNKYTESQKSLNYVRNNLIDIGRSLRGLGETLESNPLNCSVQWSTFADEARQVEGLVKQFKEESDESQRLAESLRKLGFTFPPSV